MLRFEFLLSLAAAAVASSDVLGPVATLDIANKVIAPDGFPRAASLVNGVHPAPLITAKKGDRFKLNVVNRLTDKNQLLGTSIHWHGLHQRGTVFMDGAAGITQCPIGPGDSFLYTFNADQAGTFWYHSHFDLQYCDGVRGPLVIYDPEDPLQVLYDVDDESTVITLTEWYHTLAPDIMGIASAESTLINGKGRDPTGPKVDLAVVNVERGKRYRFRVIAISCEPNFNFAIDGHPLQIIEADGVAVRPHTVDLVQILSGQRYSVVVNANQTVGNYWIRAKPSAGNGTLAMSFDNGSNSAILRYKGAPVAEPNSTLKNSTNVLAETDLHPLCNPFAPGLQNPDGAADMTLNLSLALQITPEMVPIFSINNQSFVSPDVPVLLQIMSGARNAHDLLPKGSVITLPKNKVIQVNLQFDQPDVIAGGPHPFHLHGHVFSVVRSANSGDFNLLDPVQRDVVSVPDTEPQGDLVSIRFKTDNPGPWVLRCHINFHFKAGLAVVFAEDPEDTIRENPVPSEWKSLCPKWDALPSSIRNAPTPSLSVVASPTTTTKPHTTSSKPHTTSAKPHTTTTAKSHPTGHSGDKY